MKVFGITGWTLMILGVIVPLGAIIIQISQYLQRGLGFSDIFIEGLFFGVIFFVLVFLPGFKYFKISKERKNNKLESWAVWLMIATILLEIALFILLGATGDAEGVVWGMAILGGFLLVPYGAGILLLIINLFVKKK